MKLATFSFNRSNGWQNPIPKEMDSPETLLIVFGASSFIDFAEPLTELKRNFPLSKVVGCSTAGEISGQTVSDNSLSGAIIRFESTCLDTVSVNISGAEDSFAVGSEIALSLNKKGLRGVMIFADGLDVNGTQLVNGLNSVLPPTVVITGGLAGDGERFKQTWVLNDGIPQKRTVSAVGFYGEKIKIGHGSKGGWDIFGPERRVTKSDSNQVLELDGKPALMLYKKYLGELADGLPASALLFPLSLRLDSSEEKRIVRTILSVGEEDQSMTFAGDVPQGSLVQLMRGNVERLIQGAADAAENAQITERNGGEMLSIAISCVGRRLVLGERTEEELEAVLDTFDGDVKQIGFYSYGEISPYSAGFCDLHNQTMTLTTICED